MYFNLRNKSSPASRSQFWGQHTPSYHGPCVSDHMYTVSWTPIASFLIPVSFTVVSPITTRTISHYIPKMDWWGVGFRVCLWRPHLVASWAPAALMFTVPSSHSLKVSLPISCVWLEVICQCHIAPQQIWRTQRSQTLNLSYLQKEHYFIQQLIYWASSVN